jgi:hypothetical protein
LVLANKQIKLGVPTQGSLIVHWVNLEGEASHSQSFGLRSGRIRAGEGIADYIPGCKPVAQNLANYLRRSVARMRTVPNHGILACDYTPTQLSIL